MPSPNANRFWRLARRRFDAHSQDQAWLEKLERALDMLLDDPPAYLDGELAALIELRAGIRARRSASDSGAV